MRYNLALRAPDRRLQLLAWLLLLVVFLTIGWRWWALGNDVARTMDDVGRVEGQVRVLRATLAEANQRVAPRRRALALRQELSRYTVDPGLLRRIEPAAPDDVWLTSADLSGGRLTLDGRALSWPDVARFVLGLAATPGVTDVTLTSVSARGKEQNYEFHVLARLTASGDAGSRTMPPGGREGGS